MEPRKIAVIYASTHGQTERIARRIADVAAGEGATADAFDVRRLPPQFDVSAFDLVVLAGSVHFGRHQRRLRRFVEAKLAALACVETAFVSVSGAAASSDTRGQAESYAHAFLRSTGLAPDAIIIAAGGVPYTRYGPMTRLLMKTIASVTGRSTDTSLDHEYTDWPAIERFARTIAVREVPLQAMAM